MRKFGIAMGTALAASSLFLGGAVVRAQSTGTSTTVASTVASTAPTTTAATTTVAPPAPAAVGTFTLPLLGVPLTVAVTTDVGGGLLDVSLSGTDAGTLDPAAVKRGKVAFVNEAGTVRVKVSTRDGGERVQVRAGALSDISGAGGWSGDIFGDGQTSTVGFTIGAGSDGGPDITGITATSPAQFTIGDVRRSTDDDDDDEDEVKQTASVSITFTQNGQTRSLSIRATVKTEDGATSSSLKISLGRLKGAAIADGPAVGAHTWSGSLCDGTAATIAYTVADDGSITIGSTTPAAEVRAEGDEAKVSFARGERVRISTDTEDGVLVVRVRERFRCDSGTPTVNGSVVPTSTTIDDDDDDDDHGDHDGDHGDGDDDDDDDHDGDHRNRDRRGGNGSTTTTVAGGSQTTVLTPGGGDDDDDDHDDDHGGGDDHDDD